MEGRTEAGGLESEMGDWLLWRESINSLRIRPPHKDLKRAPFAGDICGKGQTSESRTLVHFAIFLKIGDPVPGQQKFEAFEEERLPLGRAFGPALRD